MNKVIRNGQVAVLYSPSHGGGWYSWNPAYPELLFDPAIVEFLEKQQLEELKVYITLKYPDVYTGGLDGLMVGWLPEGTEFIIEEYDGAESIKIKSTVNWIQA